MSMRMSEPRRQPHAALDLVSRQKKGLKIERLLDLAPTSGVIRVLEIGTGSGGIAHYFAHHQTLNCQVDAVDVVDQRKVSDGYKFLQVTDTRLPFADQSFDVVITNHVIEHVGDREAQLAHLREVRRVMAQNGIGYLAVPNRWMLIEPHYRLIFLSWWPHAWRTPYLRIMRKGKHYDCEPLQMRQLERMLELTGLAYRNMCIEAWRAMLDIERSDSIGNRLLKATPDPVLAPLKRIIPTLIYRIEPA